MRIINEFNLGYLRCTLLHYNGKYTLKIEDEFGEVNYKMGAIDDLEIDMLPRIMEMPHIKKSLIEAFRSMKVGRDHVVQLLIKNEDDYFEDIL